MYIRLAHAQHTCFVKRYILIVKVEIRDDEKTQRETWFSISNIVHNQERDSLVSPLLCSVFSVLMKMKT
jgi:hypothetical protein